MGGKWPLKTIAECASPEPYSTQIGPFGEKLRAHSYVPAGVPVLRGTNVNPDGRFHDDDFVFIDPEWAATEFDKFECEAGDVILCHKGTLGKIGIIPKNSRFPKYVMGNSMLKVRCDRTKLEPLYLYYWLCSADGQNYLFSRVSQVGVPQIQRPLSTLREALLPIPPLPEQRAIIHILGTLDDKIELNRRMNETLEAMARALFKSWFVDFDPVRAKAEGRQPAGMDPATAALFPSEFQDSEQGPIPKGWTCAPLGEWVETLSGGTPSKTNAAYWDGNIPWISPKVMASIHADHADQYVTEAAIGNGTRIAPAGATLVMVRGMGLHQEVRVSQVLRDVTFNQDVKALIGRRIDPTLLLYALLNGQQVLLGRVESSGHGTGKLSSEVLLSYPITMPDARRQHALAQPVANLNSRIAAARAESRTLAALRDALLPRLLSGEPLVGKARPAAEATT